MATASELPIDTSATALDMADAMFGSGITLVSASYTGATGASGIYSNGDSVAPGVTPSDSGVILSTGMAQDITNSSGDANVSSGTTTDHGGAGDTDLTAIAGMSTFDAAVLEADFVPAGSTLTMQIVFSSEEYLEFANSGFNDAVGIWVNGVQAELTVGTGAVSIDNINDVSNENLYVDNPASADTYNTEMDGFTVTLTLKAPVNPGEVNTIKIGIADGGDGTYDSNLLIAGDSVQTALVAEDDEVFVRLGTETVADLLANDTSATGSQLTITHINGQPVNPGDTVTLASGETIQLTATGFVLASSDDEIGENFFSYTVTDELGNTDVGFVSLSTTPCFVAGTGIMTPAGERAVEDLRVGDLVSTLDNGPQPLVWVGTSRRDASGEDAPVRIAANTFGTHRQTEVSPLHRVLLTGPLPLLLLGLSEALGQAQYLVNGGSVRRAKRSATVQYVHLLFERHEIVFGDGLPSESYQPGKETTLSFDTPDAAGLWQAISTFDLTNRPDARPGLKRHETMLLAPPQARMRQPVRKIHPITTRQSAVNPAMANRLTATGTSANP